MKAIQKCLLIIDNPRSQSGEQLEWPSSNRLKKKKVQKLHVYKAHFGWVSKIIQHCIGFALLRSVIGTEISRYFINQSYAKLKPIAIATKPIAFSSASSVLYLQLFRRSLKSFTDHGEHVISNIVLGCFC